MSLQDLQVCVKVEPGWEDDEDVREALAALYAGHIVKEELVLGPELLQPAAVFKLQDLVNENLETNTQASLGRACSVRLERMLVDMEHCTCRVSGKTYKFGRCVQNQGTGFEENLRQTFNNHDQSTIKNGASETNNNERKLSAKHVKGLHGAKYFCNECQYSTKQAENLLTHIRTHNERKNDQKTHKVQKHNGQKPFKCNQCNATFVQSCHLTRHLKNHTDVKPYECSSCNFKCRDRWSLARHIKTHTGKKGYKCSECGASFNQSCNLLRHLRIHTGEKRYKCSYCDAAFVQSCDLGKHVKIHSGKGRFECNFCVYKTGRLSVLKTHVTKWHGGKARVKIED